MTINDRKWREFGDMAIQNNTWVMELVGQDDKVTMLRGRSSVVFQKAQEGWWIVDHHAAVNPPPT